MHEVIVKAESGKLVILTSRLAIARVKAEEVDKATKAHKARSAAGRRSVPRGGVEPQPRTQDGAGAGGAASGGVAAGGPTFSPPPPAQPTVSIGDLWEEATEKALTIEAAVSLTSAVSAKLMGLQALLDVVRRAAVPYAKSSAALGTEWLYREAGLILGAARGSTREPPDEKDRMVELGLGVALGHDLSEVWKSTVHDPLEKAHKAVAALKKASGTPAASTTAAIAALEAKVNAIPVGGSGAIPPAQASGGGGGQGGGGNAGNRQQQQRQKQGGGNGGNQTACFNCGRPGHRKSECRFPGGGSHVPNGNQGAPRNRGGGGRNR